jgi:hypothetical protein
MEEQNLSYPIGKYNPPITFDESQIKEWIEDVATLPIKLRQTVNNLTPPQLETPYRPGGWTVRQLVHHVADSHMNAYIRFKLALTEDNPTIKPYDQDAWSQLPDSIMDIEISLKILENIHARWVAILRWMKPQDFEKTYFHPEQGVKMPLYHVLGLYSWHSRHHTAHIEKLIERMYWS